MESAVTGTFSMPKAKTITQIRPYQMTKTKATERLKAKAKAVILVPPPTNSVLKYLILLLQHPSKLKYF